jgi:hypothetical protein
MTPSPRAVISEPEPHVLDANRLRVVLDLATRMRAFEAKFGIDSSSLPGELASGRLLETSEITDWLTAYKTLTAVLGSESTPAE